MRIYIILLSLLACMPVAYGQEECIIEGNILNMPDSVSVSLSIKESGGSKILDSDYATMRNGKFRIIRKVDKKTCMMLTCHNRENTSSDPDVWIKPGATIKITGDNNIPMSWKVVSDIPEQLEYNRFMEANHNEFIEIRQVFNELVKFSRKARGGDTSAKAQVDSVKQVANKLERRITQNDLTVLKENPIGIVGLGQLEKACKWFQAGKFDDREQVVTVYNLLTDEQKQSEIGKRITASLFTLPPVQVGEAMVDSDLKDLEGDTHHLADFKGKYILLDFWSQTCSPCLNALPELKKITTLYKDKVTVISLTVDTDNAWKKSSENRNITWLNLSDNLGFGGIAARYKVFALPAYVLISPEGIILDRWDGYSENSLITKLKDSVK